MNWPLAVDPSLLSSNEEEKKYRGQTIIEMFLEHEITGNFLEIGCKDGYATLHASKYAIFSVGYDDTCKIFQEKNCLLTNNFNDVYRYKPYQIVLMFDIINHIKDPKKILLEINKITDYKSFLYVRTHPWQSRNATHEENNLAYIHLYKNISSNHSKINIDDKTFQSCGYKIVKKREIHEEIEPFFLKQKEKLINAKETPKTLQYVDYILKKNDLFFL